MDAGPHAESQRLHVIISGAAVSLTVEAYGAGGRDPIQAAASRVLIKDHLGNPLVLAVEYEPGRYLVAHCDDPEFAELVQTFGVKAAQVRTRVQL